MSKNFYLAPTSPEAGLTSVSLGLVLTLQSLGLNTGFFKPITRSSDHTDRSQTFAKEILGIDSPPAITLHEAQEMINRGEKGLLLETIIANYLKIKDDYDIIVVEGLIADDNDAQAARLNVDIAGNIDSEVMLVASEDGLSHQALDHHIRFAAGLFASPEDPDVLGVILNKVGAPNMEHYVPFAAVSDDDDANEATDKGAYADHSAVLSEKFQLIGTIPFSMEAASPRVIDLSTQLGLEVAERGDIEQRRLKQVLIVSDNIKNILPKLSPGTLVVTSGNRVDVMLAACMAAMNGVELAGIVLTGNTEPDAYLSTLCGQAFSSGLPVLRTDMDTYRLAYEISHFNSEAQADDLTRMRASMELIAESIDTAWLDKQCQVPRAARLSPPAFRYQLSERSRAAAKTIVLPEGNEPRTICAAVICHERDLANCILIGKEQDIRNVAALQGVEIPSDLKIVDPDDVREDYVAPMVELRKHKGLTPQMALAQLEDNVVLATMMVALDEVDGLVSGAVHTTANTVRPALQLIKTSPDARVVSSVFFMCLPEQVLVYGDCAINPDPNAEELADIAIQSAESAIAFGIEPKVAMISYSTGTSGSGDDVDKVREATKLAQAKRPDLIIDGPLQYDAASVASVAKKKAPESPVAGQATVFIFPDLNTGNTTYKAVQRSANVISVGPMLQGLKKPVNDLSRGALVEDIVFTIALTAVQAKQVADKKAQLN